MAYPGQGYGPGGGGGGWNHQQGPPQPPPWGGPPGPPPPWGAPPGQSQPWGGSPHPQQQGYGSPPPQQGYGYQQGQGQYPPQQQQHQYHQQQQYQQQYPSQQQGYGYGSPPPQVQYQSSHPFQQSSNGPPHGSSAVPPPRGAQQFGHGAPQGYTFQYSNCTGKRKALIIGINYIGQSAALNGCINDANNVSNFLIQNHNYKREDMVVLTDDQSNQVLQPTKQNILRAMNWLVNGAQPNDSLFLHYSGHGGQTKDLDGDEDDGYDEVIYPVDFKTKGHIVDDEIHAIVVKPLQAGVRLTAIFDSCHSGSVMDLPYLYSTKGVLKEPNLAKEAGQGLLSAISSYAKGDMSGVTSSFMNFAKTAMAGGDKAYEKTIRTKTSPADVILWSGSKDDQTSADANIASQATGAMSWAFITALQRNPNQTYLELLNSIRDVLQTKYTQKPQLSCSHPLDVNLKFIM